MRVIHPRVQDTMLMSLHHRQLRPIADLRTQLVLIVTRGWHVWWACTTPTAERRQHARLTNVRGWQAEKRLQRHSVNPSGKQELESVWLSVLLPPRGLSHHRATSLTTAFVKPLWSFIDLETKTYNPGWSNNLAVKTTKWLIKNAFYIILIHILFVLLWDNTTKK